MKERLIDELMAMRAAQELSAGDCCNLGIGVPLLCVSYIPDGVMVQSENGVLGYGIPYENDEEIIYALRFTLSKDIAATVHAGDVKFLNKTIEMVRTAGEILPPEQDKIDAMVAGVTPIFSNP